MKNILLIENDDAVIKQILSAINFEDYSIDVAESPSKAFELALKALPVLIICNTKLFEPDEDNLLLKFREQSFTSIIPFIYLVEKGKPRENVFTSNNELNYYIAKPFSNQEVQKIAVIALTKYSQLLEKTEKKLNDLRGSISFALPHEFFTPLNGIIGFSEILTKDLEHMPKDEIMQMLNYINRDALRLKRITENFLSFAQLEMLSIDPEKVSTIRNSYFINPKEIITDTSKSIAEELGRETDLVLELEDAVIRMTESYIKKIISETVDNAFKFSATGSQVIVSMFSNNTSVLISVQDAGRGMAPEQINSIGAYMQFDRKIYEQQGSGLGLIISKKITEIHGGSFIIESTVNEGTKINIMFDN